MKNIFQQPLLHFLLIGLGFFLVFEWVNQPTGRNGEKTVVVNREVLLNFLQYRAKSFDRASFETRLDGMTPEELAALIEDFVREEVLHREALALGLDRDDYVIRRRLVQKLEFITRGFAEHSSKPSKGEIRQFFEENKENYYVRPHITFTHIFFDSERHGVDQAKNLARQKLAELRRTPAPFTDAPKHGDRFLYHLNYVERTRDYVASHFGTEMAKELFNTESLGVWQGPLISTYGAHLVLATDLEEGRFPHLEEISERVTEDARMDLVQRHRDAAIQGIIDGYEVRIGDFGQRKPIYQTTKNANPERFQQTAGANP